jgi:hypothetical protein
MTFQSRKNKPEIQQACGYVNKTGVGFANPRFIIGS